jgi:integrase
MIAVGAPVTEVQHRLGHANPTITLQVHSHLFKHTESDAADRLTKDVLNGAFLSRNSRPRATILRRGSV